MASLYVECPRCGGEIEVTMIYEYDPSIGIMGGWASDETDVTCGCVLSDAEYEAVYEEAERKAAADPTFGNENL